MFNPKPTFDIKQLWNKLGTFYSRMTPEGKKIIETYWDALFKGMEGLYYDLYQVNLSSYLESSPGYIEDAYVDYGVIFEGVAKNTELLPYVSGNYYYDLPGDDLYLTIPTLSGKTTGQILYEGLDYEIHNFNQLKFLKNLHVSSVGTGSSRINIPSRVPLSYDNSESIKTDLNNLPHSIGETYLATQAITLVPSLSNFIIPAFGRDEPRILLESGYYEPYTSGWRSGTINYYEKRKQWANHLTKWAQSMIACFAKPPTLENLEQTYSIVRGFPFAYRGGVVNKIEKGKGEGNNWDYITVRVDDKTNAYIALGAIWSTSLITQIDGNFLRVFSKGMPPLPHEYAAEQIAKEASHDFWFPLNPRENSENSQLIEGNVGIHLNGIPFVAIPNYGNVLNHSDEWEWLKNHLYGDYGAINFDNHNGAITPEDNHYFYAGDPVDTYTEDSSKHSPLIGYALDGFPIYGKIGYINPDGSGGVKEMDSSYTLITEHSRPDELGGGMHTGEYRNDFKYVDGHGDLDENNGRFAATPEYPDGIYHYHVTTAFPYMMNGFRGIPSYTKSALPIIGVTSLSTPVVDVYEIPTGGKYLFSEGDPIEKFDILLSGVQFCDYLTNPDVIDSIVTASGTTQRFDVSVAKDFEYKKGFVMNGLTDYVIYTGSYLQDADVNYVDILSDDDHWWQNNRGGTVASGMDSQDPLLNVAPGKYDPALPTLDAIYQSFAGNSTIDPSVEGTLEGTDMVPSGTIYTTNRPDATPARPPKTNKDDDTDPESGGNITY